MSWKHNRKTIHLKSRLQKKVKLNECYIEVMDEYREEIRYLKKENDKLSNKLAIMKQEKDNAEYYQAIEDMRIVFLKAGYNEEEFNEMVKKLEEEKLKQTKI